MHVLLGVTLWRQERPKTSGICSRTPIMNSIVSSQLWTEESCAKYVASKGQFLGAISSLPIPGDNGKIRGICLKDLRFRMAGAVNVNDQRIPFLRSTTGLAGGTPGNYSRTGIDSDVFPHTGYFHHTAIGYDFGSTAQWPSRS